MRGYLRPSLTLEAISYDKDAKERYPRARKERRGGVTTAKLSEDDVRWVRTNARRNGGKLTYAQMASHKHVSTSTIRSIVCGLIWRDVE